MSTAGVILVASFGGKDAFTLLGLATVIFLPCRESQKRKHRCIDWGPRPLVGGSFLCSLHNPHARRFVLFSSRREATSKAHWRPLSFIHRSCRDARILNRSRRAAMSKARIAESHFIQSMTAVPEAQRE
jgi:hypothetical protein